MFPCREGLSLASFRTCWSWSSHETKYYPENDAKSPFAVPHTLSGRAVLRLWQFSNLCDSTARASVQEPCSCWCVMGLSLQSGWHHPLAVTLFCEVFLTNLICLIPKLESIIWFDWLYLSTWKRLSVRKL